jgi:elongation factor Ts
MSITAAQVKELRERTGAGMMECKKALVEAAGDMEKAITAMRKAGQAKAAKKAGRTAAEGIIAISVSADNKTAFMVEINTETDFAARDANFKAFVEQVVNSGLEHKTTDLSTLLALPNIPEANEALIAKIGENIQIRRVAFLESEGVVGTYCHASRIGVLVELSTQDLPLSKDIAMHIAASKPENEISLVGQPFVKDPSITIGELLNKMNAKVLSFVRFEVGEGIEKPTTDFAEEVKKVI